MLAGRLEHVVWCGGEYAADDAERTVGTLRAGARFIVFPEMMKAGVGNRANSDRLERKPFDQISHMLGPNGRAVFADGLRIRFQARQAMSSGIRQEDAIASHEHDKIGKRVDQRILQ